MTVARYLSVLNCGIFTAKRGQAAQPKDACSSIYLGSSVPKDPCRRSGERSRVKAVIHDQKDINIVRIGLGRNERAEHDKPCQMPGHLSCLINLSKALGHDLACQRGATKPGQDLRQRGTMNTRRKVTVRAETGNRHGGSPPQG